MIASTLCSLMSAAISSGSPVSPTTSGTPSGIAQRKPVDEIVEHDDALAGVDERVNHVAADIPGAAGDQDGHGLPAPLIRVSSG